MGSGHRDFQWDWGWEPGEGSPTGYNGLRDGTTTEVLEPDYLAGARPEFRIEGVSVTDENPAVPSEPVYLEWNGSLEVVMDSDVVPARATLIALASTTHGNDMNQRFVELGLTGGPNTYTVHAPQDGETSFARAVAPPGYYMLFLLAADGTPSVGQYVQVGEALPSLFECSVGTGFSASQVSCLQEPIGGVCPALAVKTRALSMPPIDPSDPSRSGFLIAAPAGMIRAPDQLTESEEATVVSACTALCQAHFGSIVGASANCAGQESFSAPSLVQKGVSPVRSLVPSTFSFGEGVFVGEELDCSLVGGCASKFDEHLTEDAVLGVAASSVASSRAPEYRLGVASGSEVEILAPTGSSHSYSPLSGDVGFSFSTGDSATAAQPFYLASLEVLADRDLPARLQCPGSEDESVSLSNLVISLEQPAFGVESSLMSTSNVGFAPGSLIFDVAFDADKRHFSLRRSARNPVYSTARPEHLQTEGLSITLHVPCPSSGALAEVELLVRMQADTAIETPPEIDMSGMPDSVACPGTVQLSAQVRSDSSVALEEWYLDGVRIDEDVPQVTFTEGHNVRLSVTDTRGATTTMEKTVQCG